MYNIQMDLEPPEGNFTKFGYMSKLIIVNMGQGLLMIAVYSFLLILYLLTYKI